MNVEALVLVVLLWAVLLIPSALRSRTSSSPHVTVGGFQRAMDVLKASPSSSPSSSPSAPASRGVGRRLLVPGEASRIVEHQDPAMRSRSARGDDAVPPPLVSSTREDPTISARRVWFLRLIGGTIGSLLVAIVAGGALLWTVALVAFASTGAYVALLRRWKLQQDQVRDVVRELEVPPAEGQVPADMAAGGERGGAAIRLRRWYG